MNMWVYMCACMWTCVCTCGSASEHVCIHMDVHVHVHMSNDMYRMNHHMKSYEDILKNRYTVIRRWLSDDCSESRFVSQPPWSLAVHCHRAGVGVKSVPLPQSWEILGNHGTVNPEILVYPLSNVPWGSAIANTHTHTHWKHDSGILDASSS